MSKSIFTNENLRQRSFPARGWVRVVKNEQITISLSNVFLDMLIPDRKSFALKYSGVLSVGPEQKNDNRIPTN